jgi:hypothetical protein
MKDEAVISIAGAGLRIRLILREAPRDPAAFRFKDYTRG